MSGELVKPSIAAFELGVSVKTVYRWVASGLIGVRLAGVVRVRREELEHIKRDGMPNAILSVGDRTKPHSARQKMKKGTVRLWEVQ
jgi:hypothetical protein